jgi:ubiquinone/menaquinone biosynthesis C-methylase UbiE
VISPDKYKITAQSWDKVASLYQNNFMDLDLYNDTYDLFCKLLEKPGAKILEIGCGPGNITKYLLSQRPDFIIDAIDNSPNMIELAKENNPKAHFSIMDAREINRLKDSFDGVVCGFCIPYLSKEDNAKLIKDCSLHLNRSGIFYCSVLEGDYRNSGYETGSTSDQMFVYYYDEFFFLEELKKNGLELIDFKRKHFVRKNGKEEYHLVFTARKN